MKFTLYKLWCMFELSVPRYEKETFGHYVGELRKVELDDMHYNYPEMRVLPDYLHGNRIMACTFRGKEEPDVVRHLNSLGFLFVSTYSDVVCVRRDFTEIEVNSDIVVEPTSSPDDYEAMCLIKHRVYDYSTYQVDSRFDSAVTSLRNVKRLRSYFNNPNHVAYVCRVGGEVVGYLQFVLDKIWKVGYCVNGAVSPDYHGLFLGAKLYSDAFKGVFGMGCDSITSGYSNQNFPVMKLHQACGFKVSKHEIHLRLKL